MLTGNREFTAIYEEHKDFILRTAYKYSGSKEAAEDIMQETFLKLYMGYDTMKKDNISSWLYTTARNQALNYRKKMRREELTIDDEFSFVPEPKTRSTEEDYMEDESERERRILHEKIFDGLMKKNPRWHEAIVLVYYMKVPQAKAAELMGMNLRTIHSLLHRARKWIEKKYGAEYEEMNRED